MKFWHPLSALVASLGLLALSAATAQTAPAATRVATVEGVTEYRLANGLQVLLYPDPAKPTVTVNVTYKVGSRHENYGETGMAHLLEHLIFKGSKNHPRPDQESTAPTTSRPSRRPTTTCAGRSNGRPTRWSTRSSRRRTSTPR